MRRSFSSVALPKGLNVGDRVCVFVLTQLAASSERVGSHWLSMFEFI
jgi:hypothetical protein